MKFILFVLSAAAAVISVLLSLKLFQDYYQPKELQIAAAALAGAALVLPLVLTLSLGRLLSRLRFTSRFVLIFALAQLGALAALLRLGGVDLEDASLKFAELTGQASAPSVATEPAAEPLPGEGLIERLNHHRAQLGLPRVAEEQLLSAAAQKHAQYIQKNYGHPELKGLGMYEEQPELPGYSEEGARSGQRSVIFVHTGALERAAIDHWMGTFFHRLPLVRPELALVGVGSAKGEGLRIFVLDAGDRSGGGARLVTVPKDGQEEVPVAFSQDEALDPVLNSVLDPILNPMPADEDGKAGYPVTIIFEPQQKVSDVVVTFLEVGGGDVAHHLSTPQAPVISGRQGNAICLIAHDELKARTSYEVRAFATVDGRTFETTIRFKTR